MWRLKSTLAFIEESSEDVGLVFAKLGNLGYREGWLGHISGSLLVTRYSLLVTRPPASPYISHTCKKQLTELGRTGVWYFDRLLGST